MILQRLAIDRVWWPLTIVLLSVGAMWAWASRVPDSGLADRMPSPREGFPAPDIALTSLVGETVSLAEQRGKVVVVNLWASWCGPCRAEMPALQRLYEKNRDRGFEVLAVNSTVQDSVEGARSFVDEFGLTFTVLLDTDGAASRRYLLRALPSTYIVDREGVIRVVLIGGPVSDALLQSKVESLLSEP